METVKETIKKVVNNNKRKKEKFSQENKKWSKLAVWASLHEGGHKEHDGGK